MSKRFKSICAVGATAFAATVVYALLPPSAKLTAKFDRYAEGLMVFTLTNEGRCGILLYGSSGDWSLMRNQPLPVPKGSFAEAWFGHITQSTSIVQHSTTLELQCVVQNRGLRHRLNRMYLWIAEHSDLPHVELFRPMRFTLAVPIPAMSFTNSISSPTEDAGAR